MRKKVSQFAVTGKSLDEVQKKVDEHIERNPNLTVVTPPKIVNDGRLLIGAKYKAVLRFPTES